MFKYLVEKEFKQIIRNKFLPKLIIVYPIIMMILMPHAANLDIKNIRVSVVDGANSSLSRELYRKVEASDYFSSVEVVQSYEEALQSVEKSKSDIILDIPASFEKDIVKTGKTAVYIASNSVDGMRGSVAASYLATVVHDYSRQVAQTPRAMPVVEIISRSRFNPSMDYKVFMVPALIVMLITIIGGFLPALNIVAEKEAGTIEQMNVTPVGKFLFIAAKLIPYWIIGFIILTITLVLSKLLYGIVPVGSLAMFYLLSSLFLIVVSGFGLLISNYSSTMQQAMFVMFFFLLIMILMSGLFTPIDSMPLWAKAITAINPMRYFIEIMRMVFLKGGNLYYLARPVIILCGFAVLFNTWAVVSYHKTT